MRSILPLLLMSLVVIPADAYDQQLQNAAESCMVNVLSRSEELPEGAKVQAFFIPAGAHIAAVQVFLSEAILTASTDQKPYVMGLGGSLDSQSIAEGLRITLETIWGTARHTENERKAFTIVYFTTEKDIRYLERIVAEHGISLIRRSLDMSSWEGVRNADCGV